MTTSSSEQDMVTVQVAAERSVDAPDRSYGPGETLDLSPTEAAELERDGFVTRFQVPPAAPAAPAPEAPTVLSTTATDTVTGTAPVADTLPSTSLGDSIASAAADTAGRSLKNTAHQPCPRPLRAGRENKAAMARRRVASGGARRVGPANGRKLDLNFSRDPT